MTSLQEEIEWLEGMIKALWWDKDDEDVEMCDRILARLRSMEWRPISEAPKDGTSIILARFGYWNATDADVGSEQWSKEIWDNNRRTYGLWWIYKGHWSSRWDNWNDGIEPSGLSQPTHFMPLPSPPKEED